MAKVSGKKAPWSDYDDQRLKKYIQAKIKKERLLGNKITVVRLAPLLKMSRTTLYKYITKFKLQKSFLLMENKKEQIKSE